MASVIEPDVKTRRLRRVEYDRLVDLGMFVGERLELLAGLLVVREPQGSSHAAIVGHIGQVSSGRPSAPGGIRACRPRSRSTRTRSPSRTWPSSPASTVTT